MKIGFIGIGKLGKDAAEVMHQYGHNVMGYDIKLIADCEFTITTSIEDVCRHGEIIFVAVPTPHHPYYDGRYPISDLEPKDFDYSIVKNILKEINQYTTKKQLVVLISTVLPGTIRREFIPLVSNYRFIYNPYLIAMGTVKWDMINPEMIIIGTEDGSNTGDAKLLLEFYKTFITDGIRYEVGTWDDAEAIKIFYNTFISTKIAMVNMIQDVAEKNGNMNTDTITGALERSTKRIISSSYMKAGMGDGGGCHPRDNIALRWLAKEYNLGYDLFDAIMKAREMQAHNIAKRLVELSNEYNLPIVILGKSYKPDVEYLEGSTTILTSYYVEQFGKTVEFDVIDKDAIYLLGHYRKYNNFTFTKNSVVLDVWREFEGDCKVYYYGSKSNLVL